MEPEGRFITVLTRGRHWTVLRIRWITSASSRPIALQSILILPSHLSVSLRSCNFAAGFPTRSLCALLISLICFKYSTLLILLDMLSDYVWWRVQMTMLLIMQFSPVSYYYSVQFKFSLQHPLLKHHHSVFFAYGVKWSFTPIRKSKWNYVLSRSIFRVSGRRREDRIFWTEW